MNKETNPIEERLEQLRFESELFMGDKRGKYDMPIEFLKRRKMENVNRQIVLLLDTDAMNAAYDSFESFASGNQGTRISILRRNS